MMDYPLCNQTVTVYRKVGEEVHRYEYTGCHLQRKAVAVRDGFGTFLNWEFFLIVPGDRQVMAGDRVVAGRGMTGQKWGDLGSAMSVGYAKPYILDGRIVHWEAGS
ncbi:MAG: hypothetical protein IJD63_01425 [Oscillospiraceae bacterium]|nr:hypothetical protein [Oscillospiraceae bacterium]